ncbi:PD-(D/E)XK nuclease family protein [Rickettsiales bacterium LUAb2]
MKLYNTPLNYSEIEFIKDLVLNSTKSDPQSIINYTIIAPNDYAIKLCKQSFIDHNYNNNQLNFLPNIVSVVDSSTILLNALKIAKPSLAEQIAKLLQKNVINENHRAFIFAKLLKAKNPELHFNEAVNLAFELAILVDNLHTEKISLEQFRKDALTFNYANQLLQFIEISSQHWINILSDLNMLDIFTYKSQVLDLYSAAIANNTLKQPIIIFGVNDYFKAMLNLLNSIKKYEHGTIIFSGIDFSIPEENWNSLLPTHPQYHLSQILNRSNIKRSEITSITDLNINTFTNNTNSLSNYMRADLLHRTFDLIPFNKFNRHELTAAINNIQLAEVQDSNEEAKVIALLIKKRLFNNPSTTISIVTTDLDLVKRIKFELAKWDINASNSYGLELGRTTSTVFFNLLVNINLQYINNIDLLAVLKHPLCKISSNYISAFEVACLMDLYLLRGLTSTPSINDLISFNETNYFQQKYNEDIYLSISSILLSLKDIFKNMQQFQNNNFNFKNLLLEQINIAEKLSYCDETNTHYIWNDASGENLYNFVNSLLETCGELNNINLNEYLAILNKLLAKENITLENETQITILGILQAEFITSDLVIIADFNENSFPVIPDLSIWHSHALTKDLGLPSKIETIGESAYIFSRLCNNKEILFTRGAKKQGEITTPSRFLSKLLNILKANQLELNNSEINQLIELNKLGNIAKTKTLAAHNISLTPNPPLAYRKQQISVTDIEKLLKNPYIYFIEKVLGLKQLDALYKNTSKKQYGIIVHNIIKNFFKSNIIPLQDLDDTIISQHLNKLTNNYLIPHLKNPEISLFWLNRLSHINKELSLQLTDYLSNAKDVKVEIKQELKHYFNNNMAIKITGTADLVIYYHDDTFSIIDYKTGSSNSYNKNNINKYYKQLILLSELFTTQKSHVNLTPKALEYWFLPKQNNSKIVIKNIANLLDLKTNEQVKNYNSTTWLEIMTYLENYLLKLQPFKFNIEDKSFPEYYKHFARLEQLSNLLAEDEEENNDTE